VLLIALHGGLAWLSLRFAYEAALVTRPVWAAVGLTLLAGGVYLLTLHKSGTESARPRPLALWILAAGVAMRAVFLFSTPVLEDDFYRYLWDGAVSANGENPFAYVPDDIVMADETSALSPRLRQLAVTGEETLWRVNHSDLRTIYPPVAQAAFALAYWLAPWQLWA
jgi:alpha-1,6-mannosyltransferase